MNIEKQFSRNAYIKTGMDFKARSTSFDSVNVVFLFIPEKSNLLKQSEIDGIEITWAYTDYG